MEKKIICIFFFTTYSFMNAQETVSFDIPFPATWFEKGLNAVLCVWHRVCSMIEKNEKIFQSERRGIENDKTMIVFDRLLGRLAYAQFCIEKMSQEKQKIVDEDIGYFYMVLKTVESIFSRIKEDVYDNDYTHCFLDMVITAKKRFSCVTGIKSE